MRLQTNNIRFENWRIDADGMLRCTARVLKEGVFDYAAAEYPPEVIKQFGFKEQLSEYIPSEEFTEEALKSLEGKPIIRNRHEWQTPDKREQVLAVPVGSVAGTPKKENDAIVCDMVINDEQTIEDIKQGRLIEVSAGYDSDLDDTGGQIGNRRYDGVQRGLRFNHVLLLPEGRGRCGFDVRILNADDIAKEKQMKVKITNAAGQAVELDITGDAEQLKKLSGIADEFAAEIAKVRKLNEDQTKDFEDLKKKNAEDQENLHVKIKNLEGEMTGHIAKLAETSNLLSAAKKELEDFSSEENMEKETTQRSEMASDEKAVMESEVKPAEREAVKKEMCAAFDVHKKTANEKGEKPLGRHIFNSRFLAQKVMKQRNINISNAEPAAIDASWKVIVSGARMQKGNSLPRMPQQNAGGQQPAGTYTNHPAMQPAPHA